MKQQAIAEELEPIVAQCGLEIDRIELASAGKRSVLRVFLDGDGPDGGGPSLDEIAEATRAISTALDNSRAVGNQPYVLEVSSRGTNRPLTEPKHYRRNLGRLVNLTLAEGKATGRISEVTDDAVTIDVDGAPATYPYDAITKAVIQVELRKMNDDEGDDPQNDDN